MNHSYSIFHVQMRNLQPVILMKSAMEMMYFPWSLYGSVQCDKQIETTTL